MRTFSIFISCLLLSGCAYYLTPRPPVMERKLGKPGSESIGTLATAADYRMIYVQIDPNGKVCAEPPPDAAGQFAATFAAALTGPMKDKTISADAQATLALSMKQLFQRSQGVQFYRDGIFALCNLYINKAITPEQYIEELRALRTSSESLIRAEIPLIKAPSFDPIAAPGIPATIGPKPTGAATDTTKPEDAASGAPTDKGSNTETPRASSP